MRLISLAKSLKIISLRTKLLNLRILEYQFRSIVINIPRNYVNIFLEHLLLLNRIIQYMN
ncbi:hypothetical protein LINPERHAP1_LOCUS7992 [Linum perenne]